MGTAKPPLRQGQGGYGFADGTSFQGEWKDGLFDGEGLLTWANGCSYEGSFQRGKRHGQGVCTFPGGERYEGSWENDTMHGMGTLHVHGRVLHGRWTNGVPDFGPPVEGHKRFVFPDGRGVYDGDWKASKRHGHGVFAFANGDSYEGVRTAAMDSLNDRGGEIHGRGMYRMANGDAYTGEFKQGRMHGPGTYSWGVKNQAYVGEWVDGKRQGHGKHFFQSSEADESLGDFYEGGFEAGTMHGPGTYTDRDGVVHDGVWKDGVCAELDFTHLPESGTFRYKFVGGVYEGEWRNRKPDGSGCMVYSDGTVYAGQWRNFRWHGRGRLIQKDGVAFQGEWRDGKMHGPGTAGPGSGMVAAAAAAAAGHHGAGGMSTGAGAGTSHTQGHSGDRVVAPAAAAVPPQGDAPAVAAAVS